MDKKISITVTDSETDLTQSFEVAPKQGRKILNFILDELQDKKTIGINHTPTNLCAEVFLPSVGIHNTVNPVIAAFAHRSVADSFLNQQWLKEDSVTSAMSAEAAERMHNAYQEKIAPTEQDSRQKPTIIMLNGPPGAGKDTIADMMASRIPAEEILIVNFKQQLYEDTAEYLGIDLDFWIKLCTDRSLKDHPFLNFTVADQPMVMATPRQLLIAIAEKVIKPKYGPDRFAAKTWSKIQQEIAQNPKIKYVVIPDLGFDIEYVYIRERYNGNIVIGHVHRPGCDFEGDSRNWVVTQDQNTFKFMNSGSLGCLKIRVSQFFKDYV